MTKIPLVPKKGLKYHIELYFCHIQWDHYFVFHIWQFHRHIMQYQHHMRCTLSHSMVFLFFLTFNGSIFTSSSTNITSNSTFIIFGGYLYFLPTFDSSILISCSTNIISDCIVITFDDNLIFLLTFKSSIVTLRSIN